MKYRSICSIFRLICAGLLTGISITSSVENITDLQLTEKYTLNNKKSIDYDNFLCFFDNNYTTCSYTKKPCLITNSIVRYFTKIQQLSLTFHTKNICELSKNVFDIPRLKELYLKNVKIKAVHLDKLRVLRILYITDCDLPEIEKNSFLKNLESLDELWISLCNMTIIYQHLFKNLKNLTSLVLPENKIEIIETNAFINFRKLIFINLNKNKILSIDGYFKNLPLLSFIMVSENNIKTLNFNEFENLDTLEFFDLTYNQIEQLDADVISTIFPNLQILKIYGNFIPTTDLEKLDYILKSKLNRSVAICWTPK